MLSPNNYNNYLNNDRFDYNYQFVRNTLQLNMGKRPDSDDFQFSEIAFISGISATDWSWAPLIADFDNDSDRDIIITNGFASGKYKTASIRFCIILGLSD